MNKSQNIICCYEQPHMDNMLILHSKCDQNVLSKNSPSTVNRSSQYSLNVITGFRVPSPPVSLVMARRSHDCHVPNRSGGVNQTSPRHSSWEIALPSAWGDLLGFPDALHPWEPSPYPPIGPHTAEIPISTTISHSQHATRVSRAPRPTVRLVHQVRGFPLI